MAKQIANKEVKATSPTISSIKSEIKNKNMKINSLLIVIVLFIISCNQAKDMKTSNVDISGNDTTIIDYSGIANLFETIS